MACERLNQTRLSNFSGPNSFLGSEHNELQTPCWSGQRGQNHAFAATIGGCPQWRKAHTVPDCTRTAPICPSTINLRLAAIRRLAYEASDCGFLSPDLAAGIRRVRSVRRLGVRVGNWLTERSESYSRKLPPTLFGGYRDERPGCEQIERQMKRMGGVDWGWSVEMRVELKRLINNKRATRHRNPNGISYFYKRVDRQRLPRCKSRARRQSYGESRWLV